MEKVRLGIIGLGSMGSAHARWILEGKVPGLELAAVADIAPEQLAPFPTARHFETGGAMFASKSVDAVLIATPHFFHTTLGIEALAAGLHVLTEKPISVHKADCERLIAAHTDKSLVFAAMFNQRTDPRYIKLRELIQSGELGTIRRVQWTVTNWFRSDAYYASGGWRATWAGEGGGVLLNQCPHNLDLFQWLFGMPSHMQAHCSFGRYHDIEVEDDVTAFMEFKGGATATFIASTGEAPGTNRLEIAADRGRVVFEHGKIEFLRTVCSNEAYCRTTSERWQGPDTWTVQIPVEGTGDQHLGILRNFTEAVLHGVPLIAPAEEGIYSVELANAMLLSAFEQRTVDLPLDAAHYAQVLAQRIAGSRKKTGTAPPRVARDLANSFGRH
ncbi:MAG: Gfo/Idh/MocA family oxidoreductase [Polyangiaceae bacterium]|nr:Gfo/Idh/MocA family oxidoreductase [Polyangiaceae bacterium]